MSGTSLDGVDAALIETDGHDVLRHLDFVSKSYPDELRGRLREYLGARMLTPEIEGIEKDMTLFHAALASELGAADLIGFHGQTLAHDPAVNFTWQIGDGALLAAQTGIDVVNDFRSADMEAGGQGAPFLPLYHAAIAKNKNIQNAAFLNIGGVSNFTFVGKSDDDILAFDCGPGNALMDDFIAARSDKKFDEDGEMAASGEVDMDLVEMWLNHSYFKKPAPKSLDRDEWDVSAAELLFTRDGLATLLEFTAQTIAKGLDIMPVPPEIVLVSGGGRRNVALMNRLADLMPCPVRSIEEIGCNGDATEAEGFAYLAVRSLLGLPLSLPTTTGVPEPMTGGVLYKF